MLDCCPKFTQSSTLNDQTFSNRRIFQRSIDLTPKPIVICGRFTANDDFERPNALKRSNCSAIDPLEPRNVRHLWPIDREQWLWTAKQSNFPAIDRFDTRTNRHMWPIDRERWAWTSKRSQTVEFSGDRSVWHPNQSSSVTYRPQAMSFNVKTLPNGRILRRSIGLTPVPIVICDLSTSNDEL